MSPGHNLYRRLRGRLCHITSVEGLSGVLRVGSILANVDGSLGYGHLKGKSEYYICQRLRGISLLDLKNSKESDLFDRRRIQNWTGMFRLHRPAIVLVLKEAFDGTDTRRLTSSELTEIGGKYIIEAEACYNRPIPLSFVDSAMVLSCRLRIVFESKDLDEILSYCWRNRHRFRILMDLCANIIAATP